MNSKLPSSKRFIDTPKGGWKENTLYNVQVSFRPTNPIHPAILFTGFFSGRDRQPGAYHTLFNPYWDENATLSDIHFLKVVAEIDSGDQVFNRE